MKLSRRALVTALPLSALVFAVPELAMSRSPDGGDRRANAVVVFDEDDVYGVRFAQAFPNDARKFGLVHGGAGQLQALEELFADPSLIIAGLTSAAAFFPLQRLAVQTGRSFALSGDHRSGRGVEGGHAVRMGLCGETCMMPVRGEDWVERLAAYLLSTPAFMDITGSAVAPPSRDSQVLAGTQVTRWLHSWLLA